MQVECIANRGTALTAKYLLGNTIESIFHLSVGKRYSVFAVAIYRGATLLLLSDDNDLPNWYPLDLFSISDPCLPHGWQCAAYRGNDNGLQFLAGYEQIASDETHYDALLERDPRALEIFHRQKQGYGN